MKRLALFVCLMWSLPVHAQFAPQEWSADQVAQDDSSLTSHWLFFPRGNAWASFPCNNGTSVCMLDNSFAIYNAFQGKGGGIPRFEADGDINFTSDAGRWVFIEGNQFSGTAQVIFGQGGPFGSVEAQFRSSIDSPAWTSTSQTWPNLYLPVVHGQPTGTPIQVFNVGGTIPEVPIVFDDLHQEFWFYSYVSAAWVALGAGAGTVTSVNGMPGQILCTPSSPNPVCSLVNTGAGVGSCTNCSVTFDALGRETAYSSGPAPVTSVSGTAAHVSSTGGTTPVIDLIATAVTPGSYVYASFTVDADGRLTAASSGTIPVTSVAVTAPIENLGTSVAPNIDLMFDNASITLNGGNAIQRAALAHDVICGAGSNTCNVDGVTDGGGTDWPVSGSFSNNQAMILAGGKWTTTNECNVFSSCSAGGGLSGTYPNPTVASVPCAALPAFTGGAISAGGTCALTLDGSSVAASVTKLHWLIADNVPGASRWIVTSSTAFTGVAALEYPNDFKAGHVFAKADFIGSVGAGNFSCFVTLNGSGIAGTTITYSGTLGIQATSTVGTGSTAANDTYGVECSPSAGGGGTINFSYELVLTP